MINHLAPHAIYALLGTPLCLLSNFAILIIYIEPVPLVMAAHISSHLIKLDLSLVVAAVYKVVVLLLAVSVAEEASLTAAVLVAEATPPALPPGNLVCIHFKPILLDSSEDVESPVIPHRWSSPDDVVWLWLQFWQFFDWAVGLFLLLQFLHLLPLLFNCVF